MTCQIGLWEWAERKGRRRWEENEEGDEKKTWEKEEEEDTKKRKCQKLRMCVAVGMGGSWEKKLKNLKVLLLSKKVKKFTTKKNTNTYQTQNPIFSHLKIYYQ